MTTLSLHEVGTALAHLRTRVRTGIRIEAAGLLLLALAGYALATWAIDRHLRLEWPFRLLLLLGFVWFVVRLLRGHLLQPLTAPLGDDELALAVERRGPELRQALISGMQFDRALESGAPVVESKQLMTAVVDDIRGRIAQLPFSAVVDKARVRRFGAAGVACALGFAVWGALDSGGLGIWARRNLLLANVDWPRYTQLAFTGNDSKGVRMPQGDALTVRVLATGAIPDQVFLYSEFDGGESAVEPMSSTGAGEFTLTLPSVLEGGQMWAEGGDGISARLRIEVVERPRITDVQVRLSFPEYMAKEPELVPPTEGELRLVRGSRLELQGRSHKPIDEAFLLFGNEQKTALAKDGDGHGFRGTFVPTASGLLVLDVIDRDRFQAGAPPKLLLRIVDDKPPTIDFKMRGIGSLISVHARIPGELKIKDDFGLREVAAGLRAVSDNAEPQKPKEPESIEPGEPGAKPPEPKPAEVPFDKIEVIYADQLVPGAVRYETSAGIDLKQINPDPEQNSEKNKVRPGMLLSVRFSAKDNFGPGDPHEAFGETLTFRVVTRDKLTEELRRRLVEQRQELQRILDEEKTAFGELKEMLNPAAADERSKRARAELKRLARLQQALGRRVAFVGEMYQRILWEFENNRLIEPTKIREIEGLVCAPLADLAKEAFPVTARSVDEFSASGNEELRTSAVSGYSEIIRRITAILEVMEQMESLAALIEELRGIIKIEDNAIQDAERRLREAGQNVFGKDKK